MTPDRRQITDAIDSAFSEHVRHLFVVLAANMDDGAEHRFAKGLDLALVAYGCAARVIALRVKP
jgi:hypothetical protein